MLCYRWCVHYWCQWCDSAAGVIPPLVCDTTTGERYHHWCVIPPVVCDTTTGVMQVLICDRKCVFSRVDSYYVNAQVEFHVTVHELHVMEWFCGINIKFPSTQPLCMCVCLLRHGSL